MPNGKTVKRTVKMKNEKCVIFNIEEYMPTVLEGIHFLRVELKLCKKHGVKVMKVIHGYGSSGTGGRLRVGLREFLQKEKDAGRIKNFVPGEKFEIFNFECHSILDKCQELRKDHDLNRHNNGVTLIELQ